jgi:hypothetical protein
MIYKKMSLCRHGGLLPGLLRIHRYLQVWFCLPVLPRQAATRIFSAMQHAERFGSSSFTNTKTNTYCTTC